LVPTCAPQLAVAQQEPVGVLATAEPITAATQTQADVPAAEFRLLARITDQSRDAIASRASWRSPPAPATAKVTVAADNGEDYRHHEDFDQAEACVEQRIGTRGQGPVWIKSSVALCRLIHEHRRAIFC
jgi:hypothetical protein